MNTPLQQKGWEQMKTILDKEMPVQKKKYRFPLWVTLLLVGSGFMSGYFLNPGVSTTSANDLPVQNKAQKTEAPTHTPKEVAGVAPINHKTSSGISNSTPLFNKNIATTQAGSTITTNHFENDLKANHIFNSNLADITDLPNEAESIQKQELSDTKPMMVSTANEYLSQAHHDGHQRVVEKCDYVRTLFPTLLNVGFISTLKVVSPRKPFALNHSLVLSGGHHIVNPKSRSLGLSYQMDYIKNRWSTFASLGYRYVKHDVHEIVDTLDTQYALTYDTQKSFDLNHIHQLILGLGTTYTFNNNVIVKTGVDFPYSFQKINLFSSSKDAALEDGSNTGTGVNNEAQELQTSSNKSWNAFDIQPYIGIGTKLNKRSQLFVTYQHGILAHNKQKLLNSDNILFQQLGIQWQYTL